MSYKIVHKKLYYHKLKSNNNYLVIPLEYSKLLFYYSFVGFLNISYGLYNNKYTHSLIPISVTITSLLYWNYPIYGFRRLLDIGACLFGSLYILYYVIFSDFLIYLLISKNIAILSYYLGWKYHNNGNVFYGVLFHMIVHLTAHYECYLLFNI